MITNLIESRYRPADTVIACESGENIVFSEFSRYLADARRALRIAAGGSRQIVRVKRTTGWRWIANVLAVLDERCIFLPEDPERRSDVAGLTWDEVIRSEEKQSPVPEIGEYLLPTSGTTGEKKLILGSLPSVLRFIEWESGLLSPIKGDVVSMLTRPTFDPFFRDLLLPLVNGCVLALPDDPNIVVEGERLSRFLTMQRVSITHITPTVLRIWSNFGLNATDAVASLRCLVIAGEPLFGSDIAEWISSKRRIFNFYGPSETTLAKFFHEVTVEDSAPNTSVPVGRPISRTSFAVLTSDDEIAGPYVSGEVVIRTLDLSRGYWINDGLVSPFLKNPLNVVDEHSVYRTGDIGYVTSTGSLVLDGRTDDQVKIRGHRVDLTTIESLLRTELPVRELAVAAIRNSDGITDLVAFFSSNESSRSLIQAAFQLPLSAQPNKWVAVEMIPRTSSGKVDRRALLNLATGIQGAIGREASVDRPDDLVLMTSIWGHVLGVKVLPDSRFFELGGQSIEAARIANLVRKRFSKMVQLRDVLFAETPRRLVSDLTVMDTVDPTARLEISAGNRDVALTPAQRRFYRRILADGPNRSVRFQFGFCARLSNLDVPRFKRAIEGSLSNDAAFNIQVFEVDGVPYQKARRIPIPLQVFDASSSLEGEQVAIAHVREGLSQVIDVSVGPLMQLRLIKVSKSEYLFLMINHVLASDGTTRTLLLKRLSSAYNSNLTVTDQPNFLDFAQASDDRRRTLQDNDRTYPRNTFDGAPLPLIREYLTPPSATTRTLSTVIDGDEWAIVRESVKQDGITVAALLLAALEQALYDARLYRQSSFLLLSSAERDSVELESMPGCFTDSVVFRLSEPPSDVRLHCRQVHERMAEILSWRRSSFVELHDMSWPGMAVDKPEIYPIIFSPQPALAESLELQDVVVRALAVDEAKWIWANEVYPVYNDERLDLRWNFSVDLVSCDTAKSLFEAIVKYVHSYRDLALSSLSSRASS